MSFTLNRTIELWQSFMPERKEIKNINTNLYSIEVYPKNFFNKFNPETMFEKWAAVEVDDLEKIPFDFGKIVLQEGLYVVFVYKGTAKEASKIYNYIYREWIPQSDYILDHRPHFALMGEKYKQNDPNSEEEIWIPIKDKS